MEFSKRAHQRCGAWLYVYALAALLLGALSAWAAPVGAPRVLPEALSAFRSGQPVDLIVEFDAADIDRTALQRRRPREFRDTPAITTFRADGYRKLKKDVDAGLPGASPEIVLDYSHLPMRLQRFRSSAALDAWLAHAKVKAVYVDGEAHPVLTNSLPLIQQPAVATAGYTGAGATVVVIDSGINYANSVFGGCTAPGTPAACKVVVSQLVGSATGGSDTTHGTNVSAIALGVAPGAKVAMLDAFSGTSSSFSNIIAGINWVIANRATYNIVAINMSLGDGAHNTTQCATANSFVTPVANAKAAGITVVAAAGNEAYIDGMGKPACTPGVISVGAVYSANFGGLSWGAPASCTDSTTAADKITCFSDNASFLTLLAPGAIITAAGIAEGGTSQASPHVAGAVAVLRVAYPNETLTATQTRLTSTGVPITDARNGLIKPRLDLLAAARPANDNYTARLALTGNSGNTTGANVLATQASGEAALSANAGGKTVWWEWTAPASGQVTLTTHGSGFDTVLAVYASGSAVTALTPIASNDNDGSANGASGLLFQALSGAKYEIAVDGANGAAGAIALDWSLNTTAAANLSISLAGPASGATGVNADYTFTVANAGPQTATNVVATIALPADTTVVSMPSFCIQGTNSLSCNIGQLANGASATINLTLTWAQTGAHTLSGSVAADLGDPVAGNNNTSLVVTETAGAGDVPTLPEWGVIALGALLLIGLHRQNRFVA